MSPEMLQIYNKSGTGDFNPEKCDVFSSGLTYLRLLLHLAETDIAEMNNIDKGQQLIAIQLNRLSTFWKTLLAEMLQISTAARAGAVQLVWFGFHLQQVSALVLQQCRLR